MMTIYVVGTPIENKKGHGKPIRRLAMTSILKQNTLCFALPL